MSKSSNIRDQIIYSINHVCNVGGAQGKQKVDKGCRGFCQAQPVKFIPTLCSNLLNLCKEGDFNLI